MSCVCPQLAGVAGVAGRGGRGGRVCFGRVGRFCTALGEFLDRMNACFCVASAVTVGSMLLLLLSVVVAAVSSAGLEDVRGLEAFQLFQNV